MRQSFLVVMQCFKSYRRIIICLIILVGCLFSTYNIEVLANNTDKKNIVLANPGCTGVFSDSSSRLLMLLSLDNTVELDSNYQPDFSSVGSRYFSKVITRFKHVALAVIKELRRKK